MSEVLRVIVRGRVQGVGYRYFAERIARHLGVSGWVRNLPGGEVEVVARVAPSNKGRFLAALQQGPSMARVDGLDVQPTSAHHLPEGEFRVRY